MQWLLSLFTLLLLLPLVIMLVLVVIGVGARRRSHFTPGPTSSKSPVRLSITVQGTRGLSAKSQLTGARRCTLLVHNDRKTDSLALGSVHCTVTIN
ncbi:hypothetical protein ElyMa_002206100 [Elysia marginata]|uniref:Secreted protein n=1 Tax=Elysia marginata TaxID=1093978 RepID=A0AAV4FS58_9GAST|nr:hypothetical protein ElyMa_002206100 [Elysia marginata]